MKKLKILWETFKGLGILTPLMVFTLAGPALGALALITTSKEWFPLFLAMAADQQLYLFLGSSIVLVGISLVPTHAASLIAGMTFGLWLGPPIALFVVVVSAMLSMVLVNLVIKKKNTQILLRRPAVSQVREELLEKSALNSIFFISLIRLSPAMPFAATNVLLSAAQAKMPHFLIGSSIGLAPRIVMVAVAGAGLSKLDLSQGSSRWLLVLGAVSTLLLIILVGKLIRRITRVRD